MYKRVAFGWVLSLLCGSLVSAAAIEVGDHPLLPNTANQPIPIWVTGVERAAALNFNVQIGDGLGSEYGGVDAPVISDVDILHHPIFGATIFGAVPNDGESGSGAITDLLFERNTLTKSGSVVANGLLAVVTIDTTGFFESPPVGHWDLKISQTLNAPTELLENTPSADPIPLSITDGTVSILIPEPATFTLLLSLFGGLPAVLICHRRYRKRQV